MIELLITAGIIAGAALFIGRRAYRSAKGKGGGCHGDCDCGKKGE